MNRKISMTLAVLTLAALLGGCQLAVPDGAASGKDVLCGVFITLEYLDISEPEISFNWKGEPEVSYAETRIYATRIEDENGFTSYSFDGIKGINFFTAEVADTYQGSFYGDGISNTLLSVSDNGKSLTGTLYADVGYSPITIFPNPAYQTPDGQVYVVPGQGTGMDTTHAGDNISVKLSETTTKTADGTQTSQTNEIEVKLEAVNTNQQIVLKQMDKDDQVIFQTESRRKAYRNPFACCRIPRI